MFSEQFGEILAALADLTTPQFETLQTVMDGMRAQGVSYPSVETSQPPVNHHHASSTIIRTAFLECDLLPEDIVEHQPNVVSARQEDRATQRIAITPEEFGLTQRQGAVLVQLLEGLPNKLIARNLGLSINTVKEHVSAILLRLDLRTRSQVIPWMERLSEQDRPFRPAQGIPVTPEELGLTQRQGAVLAQLLEGLPNKLIARNLGLSINTVKEHVSAILLRLDLRTRSQVISRMKQFRVQAAAGE